MRLWRKMRRSRSGCLARSSKSTKPARARSPAAVKAMPAKRGQAREAVHQGDQAGSEDGRAFEVEALAAGVGPFALEPDERQEERQGGDRDGGPEDAPPAPGVDEEAADDGPEGEPRVDGGRVQPERPAALAVRIDRGQDGDPRAEDHGPAEALDGPGEDQGEAGGGERAEDGPGDVDADAEGEDPLAADEVGQPSERDEEHGRGQGVGGEDPAQGDGAQIELLADEGHGHVDARGHERGQERGDHRDGQGRAPEGPIGRVGRAWHRHIAGYYNGAAQLNTQKYPAAPPARCEDPVSSFSDLMRRRPGRRRRR